MVIKSRRITWEGHAVWVREVRNAYKISLKLEAARDRFISLGTDWRILQWTLNKYVMKI
jgi:hypothetical protein